MVTHSSFQKRLRSKPVTAFLSRIFQLVLLFTISKSSQVQVQSLSAQLVHSLRSSLTMPVTPTSRCLRPRSARFTKMHGHRSVQSQTKSHDSSASVRQDAPDGSVSARQFAV